MPRIEDFDAALQYINGRGIITRPSCPGWIIEAQSQLCNIETALYKAAGNQYPYNVHYTRAARAFTVNSTETVSLASLNL